MPMHMSDDFARRFDDPEQGPFEGPWPKKPAPRRPRHNQSNPDWDSQARDSTNQDMLDHGTLQPEDL